MSIDQPWAPPDAIDTPERHPGDGRYVRVGIGEFAVSANPDEVLTTIALGSCVAVCLFDPVAKVGGMLHFLLPDSKLNADRARTQPAAFADTGIAMLFHAACGWSAARKSPPPESPGTTRCSRLAAATCWPHGRCSGATAR